MGAKKWLNDKVRDPMCNGGYHDFSHYCDCRHEDDMVEELPIWVEEYHRFKSAEEAKENLVEFTEWLSRRDFTDDTMSPEDWVNLYINMQSGHTPQNK